MRSVICNYYNIYMHDLDCICTGRDRRAACKQLASPWIVSRAREPIPPCTSRALARDVPLPRYSTRMECGNALWRFKCFLFFGTDL